MIVKTRVHGTMDTVPEVEYNHDVVYLRENIVRLEEVTDKNGIVTPAQWEYTEKEMSIAEYIEYTKEQSAMSNLDTMEAVTLSYEAYLSLEKRIQSLEGGTT